MASSDTTTDDPSALPTRRKNGNGNNNDKRPKHPGRFRFFWEFLKHPRMVASVIPSSRFLERSIVERAEVTAARTLVELGPGTGGTTRAILAAMDPAARLLAVENNPRFHGLLGTIEDPRLIAHLGCATELEAILAEHDMSDPDTIISGIPFSKMPPEMGASVIHAVTEVLRPGGCFLAYQVRGDVAGLCRPHLGEEQYKRTIFFNVPPLRLYRWEKRG